MRKSSGSPLPILSIASLAGLAGAGLAAGSLAACATVPRATVPVTTSAPAAPACTPLTVEAAEDLGAFPWEPHAQLVTDAAGQVHAVWTQDDPRTHSAVYFHGEPHGAGLRITRDVFAGAPRTGEFVLTRAGGRPAIVVWDGKLRGPALIAGPPWRDAVPLTSLITAPDAAGNLYTLAFAPGEVTLLRVDGAALTPVVKAAYPAPPPPPGTRDDPELRAAPGGLALLFWVPPPPSPPGGTGGPRPTEDDEPSVRPPTRAALLFTGLAGPAPSARQISAETDLESIKPAYLWSSPTQTFLTYAPAPDAPPVSVALAGNMPLGIEHCGQEGLTGWRPARLPRTCRARPTVQTFTPPRSVLTRPTETVVVGTEWTDRSTVAWHTPICSNDRSAAGWYQEKKRGSGRLLIARVPHGGPACTQRLPLALGDRPEGQGARAAAVDGAGRLHLLTWTYGRLRYLRLR